MEAQYPPIMSPLPRNPHAFWCRDFNLEITAQRWDTSTKRPKDVGLKLIEDDEQCPLEYSYDSDEGSYQVKAGGDKNIWTNLCTVDGCDPIGLAGIWVGFKKPGQLKLNIKSKCQACGSEGGALCFAWDGVDQERKHQRVKYTRCCDRPEVNMKKFIVSYEKS